MPVCLNCGEDNPSRARFCLACGTAVTPAPPVRQAARKTVTIVFCDVVGSTSLGERLDPESLRRVMARYFETLRAALERHGGIVEKFIGDAVMAVFGIPAIHEDDAVRAVRAAAEMLEGLDVLNEDLEAVWGVKIQARIGVNTGEVVAGDPGRGEGFATGDAVNVAARLEQAAAPGEILLGAVTERLVRSAVCANPVEPLDLKGKAAAVRAFRLVEVGRDVAPSSAELRSPLIGREDHLAVLEAAFRRAVEQRKCKLLTVLGAAGVGKSRLTREFVIRLDGRAAVVRGRCLPYGDGITYWPVAEVVKGAAGIRDEDSRDEARERLAALLPADDRAGGLVEPISAALALGARAVQPEEIFWALRKLLEQLARSRPLVVVFDDIHAAEPTFLDLLDYLEATSAQAPVLIVCMARPELLEVRPQWSLGRSDSLVRLEPLDGGESRALLDSLLGHQPLPSAVAARIAELAEGNPLFVEEFLRMLVDDGHLRREDGHLVAVGELSALGMPATIHAVLSARLDRLIDAERAVLERAAVIGKVFWLGAVSELSPSSVQMELGRHLRALAGKELVHPTRQRWAGEDGYRFGHLLVRDAAYETTLKELRADLHERFANWVERKAGERAGEYDEVIGYHLEQAYRYRSELGRVGDAGRRIAERAAERFAAAGRRALARGDMPAVVKLLERAIALMPTGTPPRSDLLLELGVALVDVGELAHAESTLTEAAREAQTLGDACVELHAQVERHFLRLQTDPTVLGDGDRARIEGAIHVFEDARYDRGLARAYFVLGYINQARDCAYEAATAMLEMALSHARRARDERGEAEIVFWLTVALAWGPTPAPDAIRLGREMLARAEGRPLMEGALLHQLALAEAMSGRPEEARQLCARGRDILEELGLRARAAGSTQVAGVVELLSDDPVAAESHLRWGYEALVDMGETSIAPTSAALLAEALVRAGQLDEAQRLTEVSEATASPDDIASQILWRTARAKALVGRGRHNDALSVAREAVRVAERTDLAFGQGEAWTTMGTVLSACGHNDDAQEALRRALEVHNAKKDIVSARRVHASLRNITRAPGSEGVVP
jgi:class 3 adenylate cyclase/tetratricopeptide (TPR) repeat protein